MNRGDAVIPYYVQAAETLRRRIHTGEYPEGTLLPTTEALEKEFGVSSITIQKALGMLVDDGLLERRRGLGTFVASPRPDVVTMELSGSFDRLVRLVDNDPTELEVLEIEVVACPHHVAPILGLESGSPVWRMKKVRKRGGTTLCYYVHYCSPALCAGITKEDAQKENMVDLFQRVTGLKMAALEQKVEAASADSELSKVLNVRFSAPLLFLENLYLAAEDAPILLTHIYYRGDRCTVKAKTKF